MWWISKSKCMWEGSFQRIFYFIVSLFLVCTAGCGTTSSVLKPSGPYGDDIHVIIDDKYIPDSSKSGKAFISNLKKDLSKSFRNVTVETDHGEPKIGELILIPDRVYTSSKGNEHKTITKDSKGQTTTIYHGRNTCTANSEVFIKQVTSQGTKEYQLTSSGKSSLWCTVPGLNILTIPFSLTLEIVNLFTPLPDIATLGIFYIAKNSTLEISSINASVSGLSIDMSNSLVQSEDLQSFIEYTRTEKALPCALVLEDPLPRFSDTDSLIPNNALDAYEQAKLIVEVRNAGKGTAFHTILEIACDDPDVLVQKSMTVGDIPPGAKKDIEIALKGDKALEDGKTSIRLLMKEKRGYDANEFDLRVRTEKLQPPRLEIVNTEINDGSTGLAQGNGNGIIENDETVELTVFIRNSGVGPALDANLSAEGITTGIQWTKDSDPVGSIQPGEMVRAKLAFCVPRVFNEQKITPALRVTDVRGIGGAQKEIAYAYKKRLPGIQYAYRIYSGRTLVQRLVNGEDYEIEFDASNTGQLPAKNITMGLSAEGTASLSDSRVLFGDLNVKASKTGQRIGLSVPRTYDDRQVRLNVNLSQDDFEPLVDSITVPVDIKAPKLSYRAALRSKRGLNILEKGETDATLEVNVINEGNLAAEAVRVEVRSSDQFLKLGKTEAFIGTIPAGSTSETIKFGLSAIKRISSGDKDLRISVTQKDFSSRDAQYVVSIRDVGATVIDVAAEEAGGKAARSAAQGPAINLMTSTAGGTVAGKTYRLACEVADSRNIDRIRLVANGIEIPLNPKSRAMQGTSKKIQLLQDLPVQPGPNLIVITARNSDNYESSREISLQGLAEADIDTPPITGARNHDAIGVVIGISRYRDRDIPTVDYALRDANVMKEYLVSTLGFNKENVFSLFDDNALKTDFTKMFKTKLRSLVVPGKTELFVYYSGHGVPDTETKKAYFVPYDFDPETISDTGYCLEDFYAQVEKLGARSTTIVIDACFSGSSEKGMIIKSASPVFLKVSSPVFGAGNGVLFTSSSSEQISSWYHEKKHGLFTYYFLSGLQGKADSDGNGEITAIEMEKYLGANVPRQARVLHNREQTPEVMGNKERVVVTLK